MAEENDIPFEPQHERSQPPPRLYTYALVLTFASISYFLLAHSEISRLNQALGIVMLSLCALPALIWCRASTRSIPTFAILSLANLAVYALPLLRSSEQLLKYPEETITRSALAVILLQTAMLASYHFTRGRPGQGTFFSESLITEKTHRFLMGTLVLSTAYSYVASLNDFIPYEYSGLIRAVCLGLGMISTFYLSSKLGDGSIRKDERLLLILCVTLQILFSCATLMIVSSISLLVLAVTGYVSGGKRLPVVLLLICVPIFALLHNGKQQLRDKYWDAVTGVRSTPTLSQLPEFYVQWLQAGLQPDTKEETKRSTGLTGSLLDRSSMIQMLCLVTDCTPYRQPFLNGDTYADIPGQFVPRFFWHDKPLAHVSTTRLSVYYGLQDENAANWTTIGFGLAAEAYANFGYLGVIGLGLLLGFLYKQTTARTSNSPMFSGAGLVVVMLAAWSFQTEFTMSIWLSSLCQACLAAILLPLAIRKLFG